MAVIVQIPHSFRRFTENAARLELPEGDIQSLIRELERRYPDLRERFLLQDGSLPGYLNIYLNDHDVKELEGIRTVVRSGDRVTIVPAMAGGADPQGIPPLGEEQLRRYSRHLLMPEIGDTGQRRLLASKVLIVGAGGLGSPVALYLAAAGVGTLGIVDFDQVDLSNLQRQILHHVRDLGRPKVESAAESIRDLNPDVTVVPYHMALTSANALEIFAGYECIVNCCDNFPSRYLVNDACVLLQKPMVDGSVFKLEGQATVYLPSRGCYRCLYPTPPPPGVMPTPAAAGILGAVCGVVASVQGIETVKLLLGLGESLNGRLLCFDALGMEFRQVKIRRDPACSICGERPTLTTLIDHQEGCGAPTGAGPRQRGPAGSRS